MQSIRITSDGTAEGTKVFGPGDQEIGGVTRVKIDEILPHGFVAATVEFFAVELGEPEDMGQPSRANMDSKYPLAKSRIFPEHPDALETSDLLSNPLQDAITSTEIACRAAQGKALELLSAHLERLLDRQYYELSPQMQDDFEREAANKSRREAAQDSEVKTVFVLDEFSLETVGKDVTNALKECGVIKVQHLPGVNTK